MTNSPTARVVFQPSGKRGDFAVGTPVLEAARELGVQIESICGGRGICGRCQIEVAEGRFPKLGVTSSAAALSAFGPIEQRYRDKRDLKDGRRLSCSTRIEGDVVVDVPEASIVAGQTIRKDANTQGMVRNPAVRPYYIELELPDLEQPEGDLDRLKTALADQFDVHHLIVPLALIAEVQETLAAAEFKVTLAVWQGESRNELVAVYPGYFDQLTGLAVDIGSTTIAAHLVNLMSGEILSSSGRANPQIRFGEDLMSRVSYAMMNEGGQERLTEAVHDAINELFNELIEQTGVSRNSCVDSVFVFNPVMHHMFFGFDATPLGQAPFNPAVTGAVDCLAGDMGLELPKHTRIHAFPLVAGHVGADAAAVVLSESPQNSKVPALVVDVGTNAEIVLWDGSQLLAASSPTGPALEGAEISSGQRAAPGAIERIRIDRETLAPRFKIIGAEAWSDEPEFDAQSSDTGVTGICGSGIIEIVGEMLLSAIISPEGVIRGPRCDAENSRLIPEGRTFAYVVREENPRLLIKQTDIRAIQLAKAALYAGVKLLMDRTGLTVLSDIRLAGAFGSYIDPAYAVLLGLVPDSDPKNVKAVGNAAGQGALMALLNAEKRREISQTVQLITKVETALEPAFQDHFVNAMNIPNRSDGFTCIRNHFGLAQLAAPSDGETSGRRGRRRRNRG